GDERHSRGGDNVDSLKESEVEGSAESALAKVPD
ncbi:unnamed protein product, partial [Allacma fusca]